MRLATRFNTPIIINIVSAIYWNQEDQNESEGKIKCSFLTTVVIIYHGQKSKNK